ncbi:TIGR03118 family protein [Methylobacterium sp. P31]
MRTCRPGTPLQYTGPRRTPVRDLRPPGCQQARRRGRPRPRLRRRVRLLRSPAATGCLGWTAKLPWGLAIAPSDFGRFSGDLLVGNFGDGTINAYDPHSFHFLGKLDDAGGDPITIGDLWALEPGTAVRNGDPHSIYFTSGVADEAQGLLGSLTANPEPDHAGHHAMASAGYLIPPT